MYWALGVLGGDHGVIGIVAVQPEAFEDFLDELPVHARCQGLLVVREHVLVQAAEGHAGAGVVFIR